jgi:hypothetical protein
MGNRGLSFLTTHTKRLFYLNPDLLDLAFFNQLEDFSVHHSITVRLPEQLKPSPVSFCAQSVDFLERYENPIPSRVSRGPKPIQSRHR